MIVFLNKFLTQIVWRGVGFSGRIEMRVVHGILGKKY